jgi:putative transcription factor
MITDKTVDVGMAKRIMQARMAKKMSQKDLAQACAIDAKVVNEYEQGKGIPNQAIITKLEKALGARLRPEKAGKGKGKGKK